MKKVAKSGIWVATVNDEAIEVFKNPDLVGDGNLDLAKKLEEITANKATEEKPSAETRAAEKIESGGGLAGQTTGGEWGTRTGTEEDMEVLGEVIKDELKLPANKGKNLYVQLLIKFCLRIGRGTGWGHQQGFLQCLC